MGCIEGHTGLCGEGPRWVPWSTSECLEMGACRVSVASSRMGPETVSAGAWGYPGVLEIGLHWVPGDTRGIAWVPSRKGDWGRMIMLRTVSGECPWSPGLVWG